MPSSLSVKKPLGRLDKDPDDILDYGLDWRRPDRKGRTWLQEGESIRSGSLVVEISPSGGLAVVTGTERVTGDITTAFLEGGEAGTDYEVSFKITTNSSEAPLSLAADRVVQRTVVVRVKER